MRKVADGLYQVAITLWVGGLWGVGYLAVPILFSSLADRRLAGAIAGQCFVLLGWAGLLCGAYLLAYIMTIWRGCLKRQPVYWLLLLMLCLAAIQLFGIQPLMEQLKQEAMPNPVMESALRGRFAFWHGVSSLLYLIQSLLGLWLVVWNQRGVK